MDVSIEENLDTTDKRELGADAIFSISTAKPGNGVEQLRDDSTETYWQSNGTTPHLINIQFLKKVAISQVCFYLDYNLDDSYTAKKVSIRSGTSNHDLIDITAIELNEPVGWVTVTLPNPTGSPGYLKTHLLQLRILSMHQNGRDTHIRQLKVFGPRTEVLAMGDTPVESFKTVEMQQYAVLR